MKHKFLVVLMAIAATLCMAFGLSACGEKPDETGKNPPVTDPNGEQGGTQEPDDGEQEPEPYTEGLCFTELYGEDGTTVIGYFVGAGEALHEERIVIPSRYQGLPVLSVSTDMEYFQKITEEHPELGREELEALVSKYTFNECSSLKEIVIPEGVTSIGYGAFIRCSALTSIDFPGSVTSIGPMAFDSCGLKTIVIPDRVTEIAPATFHNCAALASVTLGSSVAAIGVSAFESCKELTSINIPDSVTSIGEHAFRSCYLLEEVHFEAPNGWKVSQNEDMSDAEAVSGLDNAAQAAEYLTDTYCMYAWTREG